MTSPIPKVTPLVLMRRAVAFDNPDWHGFRALLEIDRAGAELPAVQLPMPLPGE